MTTITRNDIAEHLQARIDWQAQVAAYFTRGGRKMSEEVRQAVIDNRAQAYRMAGVLGIDLDKYNGRK
ncbi:hypothetical protein HYT23_01405 [Candidatus Pacearchaeota archaeon]|nr:hypothetical protein [Candidatus Pacearchaeota archaeon]